MIYFSTCLMRPSLTLDALYRGLIRKTCHYENIFVTFFLTTAFILQFQFFISFHGFEEGHVFWYARNSPFLYTLILACLRIERLVSISFHSQGKEIKMTFFVCSSQFSTFSGELQEFVNILRGGRLSKFDGKVMVSSLHL